VPLADNGLKQSMHDITKRFTVGAIGLFLVAALSLRATPVTVSDVGTGAGTAVYINSSSLGNNLHVFAGVIDLSINGSPTVGFCIDPWHWSISGPQPYDLGPLANAPKPPGPMGAAAALTIEQLWQNYYTAGISNTAAAALQIEIWKIVDAAVGGATFSLVSAPSGVVSLMGTMETWLAANSSAPAADLVAVTSLLSTRSPGQDYVIPNVPDGGWTVVLLGIAMLGLVGFRRRLAA
jgi:hypothetical protein